MFKHTLEEEASNQITKTPTFNLTESEIQRMDEIFGLSSKEKMAKQVAASERGEDIEGPDSEREDLFGKGKKTHAYQGLESNLLPGVLALLGAGFTAAHFVAMAFLPKNVPKLSYKYSWVTKHMKGAMGKNITLGGVPGNGVLTMAANATGTGTAKLGGDFVNQIKSLADTAKVANGDIIGGFQKLMMEPANGGKFLNFAQSFFSANPGVNVSTVFNNTNPSSAFLSHVASADPSFASLLGGGPSGAGTAKGLLTNMLGINKGSVEIAGKQVMKAVQQSVLQSGYGATTATVGQALVGSGALLIIGVGLLGAAAAVKLLRMKGKHSSRLQIMQDIINQINPISDTPGPDPVGPVDPVDPVDPVEEEDCEKLAKSMDNEFKVGDFVLYGERYAMASGETRDMDTSPAVILDKYSTIEEQLADPRNRWGKEAEDEAPAGEDVPAGYEEDPDGPGQGSTGLASPLQESDPDKGGSQSALHRTEEDYSHIVRWNIRNFNIRDAKRRGYVSETGTPSPPGGTPVFRREGDEKCRPYITKLSEEQFKEELAKVSEMAARHHKVAATKKIENPEVYAKLEADSKIYQDVGKLHSNALEEDMIDNYRNLGKKIKSGRVVDGLKDIFAKDTAAGPGPGGYFNKFGIARPDQQPESRAYKFINKYMIVAAHLMAKHIKELEKEIEQGLTSKAAAKVEINKDSLELTYRELKDGVLNKQAFSTRDKALHSEIVDLFRKARLIESEDAEEGRQSEAKIDRAWRTQRRFFFRKCGEAHKSNDTAAKRIYCKSVNSKESRDFTIEDYKEYLEQKKLGTITKKTKFSKWIQERGSQEVKESYSRWKELAGIIKG
jgi:hypothetical protein